MKRLALIFIGLVALAALVLIPTASAQLVSGEERASVNVGQTIDDDLYIAGKDVVVEGTVNGDVFAAGNSVTVRGTVNGDVFAAGQDVLVGGTIKGGVRTAGNTVRYSGANIGGGSSSFSQTFTVEKDTQIAGGLNFFSSNASIRGNVNRSLVAGASSVVISGTVGKDAILNTEDSTLESSAVINGSLHQYGDGQLHRDNGAQVKGETKRFEDEKRDDNGEDNKAVGILWGIVSLYAVGALLLLLARRPVTAVANSIIKRPGPSLGVGAIVLILAIPVLIILLITIIGIPLALLSALLLAVVLYLSKFFVGLAVGGLVSKRAGWQPNPYADAIIGLIIITLLELIPGVGWLVKLLVALLGIGGVVLAFPRPRTGKPAAPAKAKAA